MFNINESNDQTGLLPTTVAAAISDKASLTTLFQIILGQAQLFGCNVHPLHSKDVTNLALDETKNWLRFDLRFIQMVLSTYGRMLSNHIEDFDVDTSTTGPTTLNHTFTRPAVYLSQYLNTLDNNVNRYLSFVVAIEDETPTEEMLSKMLQGMFTQVLQAAKNMIQGSELYSFSDGVVQQVKPVENPLAIERLSLMILSTLLDGPIARQKQLTMVLSKTIISEINRAKYKESLHRDRMSQRRGGDWVNRDVNWGGGEQNHQRMEAQTTEAPLNPPKDGEVN